MKPAVIIVLVFALLSTRPAMRAAMAAPAPRDVDALLENLASDDPAIRQQSSERLMAIGASARGALMDAIHSPSAEIRLRAQDLLLHLPWFDASDPPQVRELLQNYGRLSDDQRRGMIDRIAELSAGGTSVWTALIRLLTEDPSDMVRWRIVEALRTHPGAFDAAPLRDLNADTAPLMVARGWAWLASDPAQTFALYQKAIDLEAANPTLDNGDMDFVFQAMLGRALGQRHFDDAAVLLRRQAARLGGGESSSASRASAVLLNLFAMHADFGPLRGFDDDVNRYSAQFTHPQFIYAIGRLYEHTGHTALAQGFYDAAFAASLDSASSHYEVGDALCELGWIDLAERELLEALRLPPENTPEVTANAHFRLGRIAVGRDDDFAAAEHLRLGMEARNALGGELMLGNGAHGVHGPAAEQTIWGEIEWRYFRAARKRGDEADMRRRADRLIELSPNDSEILIDLLPWLKDHDHAADARKLFDSVYQSNRKELDADKTNAELMNNLAWLCARCGERIDEAVTLSSAAIAAQPNNPAYLDTAAEAQFRKGNRDQAIRLETKALELSPAEEKFMREQLQRFKTQDPHQPN